MKTKIETFILELKKSQQQEKMTSQLISIIDYEIDRSVNIFLKTLPHLNKYRDELKKHAWKYVNKQLLNVKPKYIDRSLTYLLQLCKASFINYGHEVTVGKPRRLNKAYEAAKLAIFKNSIDY